MMCEFEPLNNFKVQVKLSKKNTVQKGSLVKNLGSDLKKNDSYNNVILINFKNKKKINKCVLINRCPETAIQQSD